MPDPVLGLVEDILALSLAAVASRPRAGARPAARPALDPEAAPPERPLPVRLAGGVAAAAAGTAAMTLAQTTYQAATGTGPSDAPGKVGRRLLRTTLHKRVPRRRRPALNHAMHWLYGTAWGVPLAAAGARARRAPLTTGTAVGLGVWAGSLVELPLLGVAPPVSAPVARGDRERRRVPRHLRRHRGRRAGRARPLTGSPRSPGARPGPR